MSLTTLDLNSDGRETYLSEPVSPLPKIWIGFILAFGFLAAEILELSMGNAEDIGPFTLIAAVVGWFYWLHCVSRFHQILNDLSPRVGGVPTYPYTSRQAVIRHFIPFYNLFWFFKWPLEMVTFLKQRTTVNILPGALLGLFIFLSVIVLRGVDGFLGLCCMFGVMLYISRKLRYAIVEHERVRGAAGVFA